MQCTQPSRCKPPFIADGQFIHVACAAIHKVTAFATQHGICVGKDLEVIIHDSCISACHTLKINQVPWSEPPIPGHHGAPPTCVVHDIWMSLGAKNSSRAPTSTAIHNHNNTPAAIARCTSQNIIALDSHGKWSALDVMLKSFHTVLHKSVAPCEIMKAVFDAASIEQYIIEAYM